MQCYIILYSREGYFLIFEKREEAFFFHGSNGRTSKIFPPNGVPITNGAGLFAFPGGALDPGEEPFKGCLREFREECGNAISFGYVPANQPQSLLYLDNLTIDTARYNILYNQLNTVGSNYTTLYLEFSNDDLRQIQDLISTTNFEAAKMARLGIHNNQIRDYDSIFRDYPFCPLDDELGQVQLWQVKREINEIRDLRTNRATDWYYNMIVFLANQILQLNINY
ncbi:NUDIX domain-containing protein [[Flexibacter] sp. ATCC 35103]|uniref:NUDIX domain-containing protein n=1 Tax=[Flexibacter] sp. ATCC 35103 TaxID=1937528 RepID=UPI000F50971B|nr:NUDIX domain-containing protein [[Flexibacter] sp. ATCC 35103]